MKGCRQPKDMTSHCELCRHLHLYRDHSCLPKFLTAETSAYQLLGVFDRWGSRKIVGFTTLLRRTQMSQIGQDQVLGNPRLANRVLLGSRRRSSSPIITIIIFVSYLIKTYGKIEKWNLKGGKVERNQQTASKTDVNN